MGLHDEYYIRPSKYGSKKIADTDLTTIEGHVILVLTDATFSSLTDDGIPSGTNPITWHGISGVQLEGEEIHARGKFTQLQLSAGSILVY